jgi:hypothetical protein
MGVNGQRHALAALYPRGKHPGTYCTGGWVVLRAGLDTETRGKILSPLPGIETRSPGLLACSQSLYWLSYPAYTTTTTTAAVAATNDWLMKFSYFYLKPDSNFVRMVHQIIATLRYFWEAAFRHVCFLGYLTTPFQLHKLRNVER